MFTGIITAVGRVTSVYDEGGDVSLHIATHKLDLADVKTGDSVAVNGVCLTAIKVGSAELIFDVSRESLRRTSLSNIRKGMAVNLEKALAVGDSLGGHFVSGHVDGIGTIEAQNKSARSVKFIINIPEVLMRYLAKKGSICIDGVSLTVNEVMTSSFEVNIVPYTMQHTIISDYDIGTKVNIEVDLIARYLERLLPQKQTSNIQEALHKHGFIK